MTNRGEAPLTQRLRKAFNDELDKRDSELALSASEVTEVHITAKLNNQRIKKLLFSRLTESDLT